MNAIQGRILWVRGVHVLLDADLARLYGVTTFAFNQAIKRRERRFPEKFRFQLTSQEVSDNSSQIVMSSGKHRGAAYRPWAFTEHGALMAATVLRSTQADRMSIEIIEVFVRMREAVSGNEHVAAKLAELEARLGTHDEAIADIISAINQLTMPADPEHDREIGFHKGNR